MLHYVIWQELNLQPGHNPGRYVCQELGEVVHFSVFLWAEEEELVLTDIDGTITKSDVLGHVMPIIGRDWAQSGVASLFSKVGLYGALAYDVIIDGALSSHFHSSFRS